MPADFNPINLTLPGRTIAIPNQSDVELGDDTNAILVLPKNALRQHLFIRNVSDKLPVGTPLTTSIADFKDPTQDVKSVVTVDAAALIFICFGGNDRKARIWEDKVLYPGDTYETAQLDMYLGQVTIIALCTGGQYGAALVQYAQ
jgi:hypothetical protein